MIDHIGIFVSDLEKSKKFYEMAFKPLGYQVAFGKEGVFWAFSTGQGTLFEIMQQEESHTLTHTHIVFRVDSHEKVNEFYIAAINAGGRCNGKPGPRPNYTENYYASFIHDFDGHNIEAMCEL